MVENANTRIKEAMANLHKLRIEKGVEDATSRFGINIPYDLPLNVSAGYNGARMAKIRADYRKGVQ